MYEAGGSPRGSRAGRCSRIVYGVCGATSFGEIRWPSAKEMVRLVEWETTSQAKLFAWNGV